MTTNALTLGIEEEYLLVDMATRELVQDMPRSMLAECEALADGQQVKPEYLRSQIEIGTRVCGSIAEAEDSLLSLRRTIIDVAASHGLGVLAVSTHPFANWHRLEHTARERYAVLSQELQAAARRMVICGMHVHVGIPDEELRVDLMRQFSYFLPHLLAMSCSSPFWEGKDTGLNSYRLTVFDALPRTGIPDAFDSFSDYRQHVDTLVNAGVIEDARKLWWDIRPSARYPTLETRVMDVCTLAADAVCIAALIACILRMLGRLRQRNQAWRTYSTMLLAENRWRAMRYGTADGLIDFGRGKVVPFADLVTELTEMIAEDVEAYGCREHVERVSRILANGTSADRQRKVYRDAMAGGADETEAMRAVVDHLVRETAAGVP